MSEDLRGQISAYSGPEISNRNLTENGDAQTFDAYF